MRPPIYSQANVGEIPRVRLEFNDKSLTRQEDAPDADINRLMKRFGVTGQMPQPRIGTSSVVDFDVDLQGALIVINQTKEAHASLPKHIRKRYPTWQALLTAVEQGTVKPEHLQEPQEAPAAASNEPPKPTT